MRTLLAALLSVYLFGYVGFRQTHVEVWEKDGQRYVIFPKGAEALYYLWRPLGHIDGLATGMRFHIGPHR